MLLRNLFRAENRLSRENTEAVIKSVDWKDCLKIYKKEKNITTKKLALELSKANINVQELTIRQWLNPDSHTVGPREANSIKQIGILTGNKDLELNYNEHFEACLTVRKIRREILKDIGEAIVLKLSRKAPERNSPLFNIYGKVDSLAEILQVESVIKIDKQIPVQFVNKPLKGES